MRMMTTFCLLLGLLAPAALAAPVRSATLDAVMVASGLEAQLRGFGDMLADSALEGMAMAQERNPGPRAAYARAREILDGALRNRDYRGPIREALRAGLSEESAVELLGYMDSELGRQITAAELAASTPEAMREMQRRTRALMLSEERVAIARRIDATLGMSELLVELQDSTMRSLVRSALAAGAERRGGGDLVEEFMATRPRRLAEASEYATASYVFTYRSIPVSGLRRYVQMLETDAAAEFYGILNPAMFDLSSAALGDAAAAIGRAIPEMQAGS